MCYPRGPLGWCCPPFHKRSGRQLRALEQNPAICMQLVPGSAEEFRFSGLARTRPKTPMLKPKLSTVARVGCRLGFGITCNLRSADRANLNG